MRLNYKSRYLKELQFWQRADPAIALTIVRLSLAARDNPFRGLGDPRLVKELGRGVWGRHIFDHHFLIYILERGAVTMYSCRAITDADEIAA
jgi:Txe/YoeB family toxin of Txe-Axe toxin-antitoxin module